MIRRDDKIWKEAKEHAESVSAKWNLKMARSSFVAEYADRKWLAVECNRLNMLVRSLCGKIGALKKQKGKVEK